MSNTVADWRAYRANVRTRHGLTSTATAATTTTTTISADAAPTTIPTTTPSSLSPPPSSTTNFRPPVADVTTTTTNHETEQWRLKYLALQEQLAQTTETQQHSVRDQVQRELALARQKSAVLGEQVQSLELCAVELAERTIERDMLATNLTRAMGRVEELEAINKDLLQANTHMSGGLDAAMASAQEERNLLRKRQARERQAIEEAEKSAADAGALATSAQETIDDCTRQVEDSARVRAATCTCHTWYKAPSVNPMTYNSNMGIPSKPANMACLPSQHFSFKSARKYVTSSPHTDRHANKLNVSEHKLGHTKYSRATHEDFIFVLKFVISKQNGIRQQGFGFSSEHFMKP